MVEMQLASNVSDRELCAAMNDAFSDYAVPLQLTEAGFGQMMRQRGLDRSRSHIAVENGEIAAIWLISVRGQRAYLISSGTRPRYRSRGIARTLANTSLADLKAASVRSLQTEVMDGNEVAAALYFKLGMSVSRQLDCYDVPNLDVSGMGASGVSAAQWSDVSKQAGPLRSWAPTWQNSDVSLDAIAERLICAQVRDEQGLAAYAAVIPESATLAQLAVRPDRRRGKLGSGLVAFLQKTLPDRALRVLNAQAGDADFAGFMESLKAERTIGQRELSMAL